MIENKNNGVAVVMGSLIYVLVANAPAGHGHIGPKPADMVNNVSTLDLAQKGGKYDEREQNEH
ncbi:MAG: hypothetical protein ABI741_05075 [Ferruginibacter sp.]